MAITVEALPENRTTLESLGRLMLSFSDVKPALRGIGNAMVARAQLTFRDQRDPWGTPWAPLSVVTLLRRAEKRTKGGAYTRRSKGQPKTLKGSAVKMIGSGKALLDTGRLRNSITFKITGSSSVSVGTNVVYAGMLQYGAKARAFKGVAPWGDVPARAFLPSRKPGQLDLPADQAAELLEVVTGHVLAGLKK